MLKIFYNGNFLTLNPRMPKAEAIAVDGAEIVAVGNNADILSLIRPGNRKENLNAATILPGFTDSHIHLQHYADFLQKINCETSTKAECIRLIQAAASEKKRDEWILGHGWNQNGWEDGPWNPNDLEVPGVNQPVYLTNKSLHSAWANQAALQLAGINNRTPDPMGGKVGRDPVSGEVNGILYEHAVLSVESVIPEKSPDQRRREMLEAQRQLLSYGITSVHDFDRRTTYQTLQTLNSNDQLLLRVHKSIPVEALDAAIELGISHNYGNAHLHVGPVKLFMDGALGTQTAAMISPYEQSEQSGMLLVGKEELLEIGQKAAKSGLTLAIHAIGDLANRIVIEALTELEQFCLTNRLPLLPNRIEHLQCVTPADLIKMARTSAVASMQPIHLCSDIPASEKFWGKRSENVYAFRTVRELNISLIFGSDAPVEYPDPFLGLHAAVNRQDRQHQPVSGWHPSQKLTLSEAIESFCLTPHRTTINAGRLGRIASSQLCDLIMLDHDPYNMPVDEIKSLGVLATMVDGEWVWKK
ncbi:MAG: amidohydrolase [Anaerolineae bacterium]|nr:amidohydrolase [Anaerolineae bacterium]